MFCNIAQPCEQKELWDAIRRAISSSVAILGRMLRAPQFGKTATTLTAGASVGAAVPAMPATVIGVSGEEPPSQSQADFVSIALSGCAGQSILLEFSLPEDILQLRFACRESGYAIDPHSVVLAFALTRPCCGGLPLNLQQWSEVWGACAATVESQGIDVGAWGHAIEFQLAMEPLTDDS